MKSIEQLVSDFVWHSWSPLKPESNSFYPITPNILFEFDCRFFGRQNKVVLGKLLLAKLYLEMVTLRNVRMAISWGSDRGYKSCAKSLLIAVKM